MSLRLARRLTQTAFVALILWKAAGHQLAQANVPSLDALCPFGAVETLGRLAYAGRFIQKLNASNIILGLGLVASILLVGGVFCGWLCPLGSLQDLLGYLRRRLGIREIKLPARAEKSLSWLRFVVLGLVLYATYSSARLWFADYDPYRTIFSLHWLFSPDEVKKVSIVVTGVVLLGALFIERLWCRFLCPLGALSGLLSRISLLKIRPTTSCTKCGLCDKVCPVKLKASRGETDDGCTKCLACLEACPGSALLVSTPGKREVGKSVPR